jgi:hypothetical protein
MGFRKGDTVLRNDGGEWGEDRYRVEAVVGSYVSIRNLTTSMQCKEHVDELRMLYGADTFQKGDIVRVRDEYQDRYSEVDGYNDLTVVTGTNSTFPSTTRVANENGDEFNVLTERLDLHRPAVSFKAGDRVVVDLDLAKKYSNDGTYSHGQDSGIMVLTEDSGSRYVQTTSHVRYENNDPKGSHNVPTRWLKPYEEPAKRVVGESIKFEDIKVGDKIKSAYTSAGLLREYTGVVLETYNHYGTFIVRALGGAVFPYESGVVFTLLEEAPEPVDENLQRLLDAEIGDVAYGTYANEYWKKTGDDEWQMIDGGRLIRTADEVFGSLYSLKYGTLEIYRKVEDAN